MNGHSLPRLSQPFLFGMVVLSPFQDTALQALGLAAAGGSPSFLMAMAAFTVVFAARLFPSPAQVRVRPVAAILACVLFVVNLGYSAHFGFEAYGENLLVKGMKVLLLFGSLGLAYWLCSKIPLAKLARWCRLAFLIAVAGFFWSWVDGANLNQNGLLHYGISAPGTSHALLDERPRGFSYESSTLGVTLISLGMVCAITTRSSSAKILIVGTTVALVALTGSKASLPIFLLSLAGCVILRRGVRTPLQIAAAIFIGGMVIAVAVLYGPEIFHVYVLSALEIDIQEGVSTATRSTLLLASVMTALQHPLGVGFTGYIPGVVLNIDAASELAQAVIPMPLNLREVTGYLTQEDSFAIGTKTFFGDMTVIFGLPFIYAWLACHRALILRLWEAKHVLALALGTTLLVALSLYISPINVFPVAIAYGVLRQLHQQHQQNRAPVSAARSELA